MIKIKLLLFLLITNLTILLAPRASSQITPDSTLGAERSVVTPNGNIQGLPATLIQGGATRGVNLFQSFSQFNVGDGQRVYFANPQGIQNILSRITGGDPSRIFGTLGVDGKANLFFLNPNGIIFGPNARLDVAGSFFGSTANSFVFDNGLQFSATNPEAPPLITVSIRPGLQFGANSSTISNTGNLQTGQDLTLAGVKLDLQGKLEAGKDLTLSATDTVKVRDTATNPFIASAGGKLLLQGNQNVDIFALNHPNSGFFSGSDMVLRSANTVGGDAYYWSNGNFRIEKLDGNLGNLFSPFDPVIRASGDVSFDTYTGASLHILAGGSVTLGNVNITGADSENGLVQDITLSDGTSLQINGATKATLDIRAGTTDFGTPGQTPANFPGTGNIINPNPPVTTPTISNQTQTEGAKISIGGINIAANGQVFLTNQYLPNTNLPEGSIQITGASSNSEVGNFSITAFGNPVTIDARGDVQIARGVITGANGNIGGNINILSGKDINIGGHEARPNFPQDFSGSLLSLVNNNNGGNISLKANGNININNNIASRIETGAGAAGKIDITSNTGNINLLTERQITSSTPDGNGGDIKLTAIQGQINTTGWNISSESKNGLAGSVDFNARGDIRVGDIEASSNSSSGEGAFNAITITSNQGSVFFNDSRVSANNSGSDFAGDIIINALNEVSILNSASDIVPTDKKGILSQGKVGRILIGASDDVTFSPQIVTINNSRLSTSNRLDSQTDDNAIPTPDSDINAGDINIIANQTISLNQNTILETQTARKGNAGNVLLQTNSGNISIDNSTIQAQTQGTGNAGYVQIRTNGGTVILDKAIIFSSVEPGAIGNASFINIEAGSVSLKNNSELQSLVRNQTIPDNQIRNAGYININASGAVTLDNSRIFSLLDSGTLGDAGYISIQANSVSLDNIAQLQTFVQNQAKPDNERRNAGYININASNAVSLNNVSSIFSFLGSGTDGQGGNISIKADTVSLNNGSKLDNSTFGSGNAGFVNVEANNFEALNGGQIRTNASTDSKGNAGLIEFKVTNNIILSGSRTLDNSPNSRDRTFYYVDENNRIPSGLFATTEQNSTGKGGDIFIDPRQVTIKDGARIAVDSKGSGDAGQITLLANRLILDNQGKITADTSRGNGGDITLNLQDLLLMRRDSLISATAGENGAGGNGGNINITSLSGAKPFPFIVGVENENSRIIANAQTGAGGRINIDATGVFGIKPLSRDEQAKLPSDSRTNRITAISEQGSPTLDGVVNLNSPDIDINDNLVELPDNPIDASTLIAQRCQAFADRGSEFINTGRGGLPPRPDAPLNSDAVWKDTRLTTTPTQQEIPTVTTSNRKIVAAPIIPATTWVFNDKGEVTLVSKAPGSNSPLFNNTSICAVR